MKLSDVSGKKLKNMEIFTKIFFQHVYDESIFTALFLD